MISSNESLSGGESPLQSLDNNTGDEYNGGEDSGRLCCAPISKMLMLFERMLKVPPARYLRNSCVSLYASALFRIHVVKV